MLSCACLPSRSWADAALPPRAALSTAQSQWPASSSAHHVSLHGYAPSLRARTLLLACSEPCPLFRLLAPAPKFLFPASRSTFLNQFTDLIRCDREGDLLAIGLPTGQGLGEVQRLARLDVGRHRRLKWIDY